MGILDGDRLFRLTQEIERIDALCSEHFDIDDFVLGFETADLADEPDMWDTGASS